MATAKGKGLRGSPKKALDYCGAFRDKNIELPSSFILPKERIPDVRDQGDINSCVGFATTNVMQILNQIETGARDRFSAGYIYGKCRPEWDKKEGMIIDTALEYLIKTGSCKEKDFPENKEVPDIISIVQNRPYLDALAKPYRIRGYEVYAWANEERKIKEIKTALYQHQIPILASTDYFGGGHAICIIGWDDNTYDWIILNSWGKEWEDNGIGKIPIDEVERGYFIVDEKNDILMPFEDVSEDKWYYKAVQHAYNAGFINGVSEKMFEPERGVLRAELAQVLVNYAKKQDEINADLSKQISEIKNALQTIKNKLGLK